MTYRVQITLRHTGALTVMVDADVDVSGLIELRAVIEAVKNFATEQQAAHEERHAPPPKPEERQDT